MAIGLSEESRNTVADHIERLRCSYPNAKIGWERPEKLHVTLKFLGETDASLLNTLTAGLREVVTSLDGFTMRISGTGVFPSRSRPRILWVGLEDPSETVSSLYQAIDNTCARFNFKRETRSFKPHVTIGRVRQSGGVEEAVAEHLEAHIEPVEFEVAEIVLYESKLQSTGSVYSVISTAELRG